MEPKSFFAGLFDWDFKQFVALKFIKVIYIIGAIVIGLGAISFIVAGFSRSFGAGCGRSSSPWSAGWCT